LVLTKIGAGDAAALGILRATLKELNGHASLSAAERGEAVPLLPEPEGNRARRSAASARKRPRHGPGDPGRHSRRPGLGGVVDLALGAPSRARRGSGPRQGRGLHHGRPHAVASGTQGGQTPEILPEPTDVRRDDTLVIIAAASVPRTWSVRCAAFST